jgi:outer membrane immunogenic protein
MRGALVAIAMFGMAAQAQAADMPDFLRGSFSPSPSPPVNWAGVYIGGQAVYGAADMDFTNSGQDLLAKLLNNVDVQQQFNISQWPLNGTAHARNSGFGGYIGYNFQWTDALIGIELNYTHGNFTGSSSGSQTRSFNFPTNYFTTATASSSSSMNVTDYGSLRVRAGYAFSSFLPYAFAGVGMGQANIDRTANVNLNYTFVGTPPPVLPNLTLNQSLSDNANAHFVVGYAAGLGIDINLYGGLFMRAEWEYLRLATSVDTSINTVRAGLGYKF